MLAYLVVVHVLYFMTLAGHKLLVLAMAVCAVSSHGSKAGRGRDGGGGVRGGCQKRLGL